MKKSELRQIIREEIQKLTESTQEYYVPWSSWFDSNPYDEKKIKDAVKKAGGKNIKTEPAYGWRNQPDVVVFQAKASDRDRAKIEDAVSNALGTPWVDVVEKDW